MMFNQSTVTSDILPNDKRTFNILVYIANSIDNDIQFEADVPSNNEN